MVNEAKTPSPDVNAAGLIDVAPDPMRYEWIGVFDQHEAWEVPGIVARWLPDGRILDVGCGSGAITELLNRTSPGRIMGVEPDPIRAEAARARGLNVITGLMDEAFLKAHGPFDAILFTDVLEHMPSPSEVIGIAKGGLSPGGYILASVPNVAHWTVRLRLLFGRFDYREMGIMDATHLRWFTRRSFGAMFEHQGFRVLETSVSTGFWLGEYRRFPFGWLPGRVRRALILALTRVFPGLFGCQHVIKAQRI